MSADANCKEPITYSVFDYSNIDEFVRIELDKNESALALARSKLHAQRSETFLKYAIGISSILLVLLIGIWLFTHDFRGFVNTSYVAPDLSEINRRLDTIASSFQKSQLSEKEIREKLNELSDKSEVESKTSNEIETQFTVFHSVELDEGRRVISGWIYSPTDLDRPTSQYCYLEVPSPGGSSETISKTIAHKDDAKLDWIGNAELVVIGKKHCSFKD